MTLTRAKQPAEASTVPVGPVAPTKMRRRPWLVLVSVALVVLGAMLSVWAYSSLGSAQEVVGIRSDIARGAVVRASDLEVVRVGVDPALQTVPRADMDAVVGKRAAVDLRAGQLLVPAAVSADVVPHKGYSVVGLSLAPGQFPGMPLAVGDRVRVVSTPGQQGDVVPAQVKVFQATVAAVGAADVAGKETFSVEVLDAQAPELAARAATGKVALLLDSREP